MANESTTRSRPAYGQRRLLDLLDDYARDEPARVWLRIPRSATDPAAGWRDLSFAEGVAAVNAAARNIVDVCGPRPVAAQDPPTVAYIGPNDVRYVLFLFGALRAGYKALFISPRNSQEGQLNLFATTDCRTLFFDAPFRSRVEPWMRARPDMRAVATDPLDHWFASVNHPPTAASFPGSSSSHQRGWAEVRWGPLVVLHTSGSTGLPKPIVCREGMLAVADAFHDIPDRDGRPIAMRAWAEKSKLMFVPMPLFHAAALFVTVMRSVYWGAPVALSLSDRPLTADVALACIAHSGADAVILPPVILEEMSHSPEQTRALSRLNFVLFGGGNLAEEAGNRLVDGGVMLSNAISSTECCPYALYWQDDPRLWAYFVIDDGLLGADWRAYDAKDGVYQLVVARKGPDPGLQPCFYTFPDARTFDTHDLFRRHPTRPDHWRYYGRADDVLVFSNGEKLQPVTLEQAVLAHPEVRGALVVGAGRFQPALLIEPHRPPRDADEAAALVERVWPAVARANEETVAHGRIARDLVLVTDPAKPLPRTPKGTVIRAAGARLYADEIDRLYQRVGDPTASRGAKSVPLDLGSEEGLVRCIIDVVTTTVAGAEPLVLDGDTDFFVAGMDSMQAIATAQILRASLDAAGIETASSPDDDAVGPRAIYAHSTPRRLAAYLLALARGGGRGGAAAARQRETQRDIDAAEALLAECTRDLPMSPSPHTNPRPPPADDAQTVILTGSTGALGSYLLDLLCAAPTVARIVCLNRTDDAPERQRRGNEARGLTTDFRKVEFLRADLSRPPHLGLPADVYARLLRDADRVVHNQWPVHFHLGVASFAPHVRGVRHLVDFCAAARKRVALVFASSLGAVDGWGGDGPVPEASIRDLGIASTGYGRSKAVASLVLEEAARRRGVPAAVVRIGQIAGPLGEKGAWNRHEWLPSLVASSLHLGVLPRDLGSMQTVDWMPVETMARLLLDIVGVTARVPVDEVGGYFHGVNPAQTTWTELAAAVQAFYGARIRRLVPFADWVDRLARSGPTTDDISKNPGLKLLDTYRGMSAPGRKPVVLETKRTQTRSEAMRESQAVTPELMKHWCQQWGF